jgi:glycine/D-amino acid oxidase-like deaminating enzyme
VTGLYAAYSGAASRLWHPDGYPVIDQIPGLDKAWLTSGHFRIGILMLPATARIITGWVMASQPPPEAAA